MSSERENRPDREAADAKAPRSFMGHLRDWADALVIAYILAMFIRTFVVELFKIPTGSMTPTLVGDVCAEFDYDMNGEDDLILQKGPSLIHVFFKEEGKYVRDEMFRFPPRHMMVGRKFSMRADQIMVDKSAYWFKQPQRGDIIVFKVPVIIYTPEKPVYIKRCLGLPGEQIAIENGEISVNGDKLKGEPFDYISYENMCNGHFFTRERIRQGHVLALGDNSKSSLDSRAWGQVPMENLRGRAIFRYAPLKKISFLK